MARMMPTTNGPAGDDRRHEHEDRAMRLTRLGHSCVRLERDGNVLVIDPGGWSDPAAATGAGAILVTHEHPDHFDADGLRRAAAADPSLEIWTNETVAGLLADLGPRVHTVSDGDSFTAAGFAVAAAGEWHATIHPDIPRVRNVCFLVDGEVFHPGDSLTRPEVPVGTLLLPVHAPWLKIAEAIDYVRDVRPSQTIGIHDGMLNERGLGLADRVLGAPGLLGAESGPFRPLATGESIELG